MPQLALVVRLLLLLALVGGVPVFTAGAPSPPPVDPTAASSPRTAETFEIEEIVVEDADRTGPEIVRSTSLLRPGTRVSEDDLRSALHRIRRLPSVLDADLRLERGSRRGLYRLRILVEEARSFFFAAEVDFTRFGRPLALETASPDEHVVRETGLAGFRRVLGPWTSVWVAIDGDDGLQAGWTRHRIFGRPALFSLSFSRGICCSREVVPLGLDPTFSTWGGSDRNERTTLTFGWPLGGTRSLRVEGELSRHGGGLRSSVLDDVDRSVFALEDRETSRLELGWVDDSTDDPLFPTRGRTWSLAIDLRTLAADQTRLATVEGDAVLDPLPRFSSRLARVTASGSRFLSRGRSTWFLGGRLALGTSHLESLGLGEGGLANENLTSWDAGLTVGHRRPLGSTLLGGFDGALRWESSLGWASEGTSDVPGLRTGTLETLTATTGLVLRNEWGVFRLGFSWIDVRSHR